MQTLGMTDRFAQGVATARAGQRLAGRALLERARDAGGGDPALVLWLAWTARSPEQAAEYLRTLEDDPDFALVAEAGLLWLAALIEGPEAARGQTLADTQPMAPASRPPAAPSPSTARHYRVACSRCEARLEVHATALGHLRECPACQQWFIVSRAGAGAMAYAGESPSTGPTVLLIDDDAGIRLTAEAALRAAGYSVETAAGAHEALELVRHVTPEIVLLDIQLADSDGFDVCRALRLFPALRAIPIVLLTGNDGAWDVERARAAGATDHMAKPCQTTALICRVQSYLPSDR
jgi:CheY-like chemotaxis protein